MRVLNIASILALLLLTVGCYDSDEGDFGTQDNTLQVALCVDTLDCGGICGTRGEVQGFLNRCSAEKQASELVGPCFSDCWSVCRHKADRSQNPNATFCTLECMTAKCPATAAETGLTMAGKGDGSCPAPDAAILCPFYYDPVDCGGCTYSNSCEASAAGFNPATCTSSGDTLEGDVF